MQRDRKMVPCGEASEVLLHQNGRILLGSRWLIASRGEPLLPWPQRFDTMDGAGNHALPAANQWRGPGALCRWAAFGFLASNRGLQVFHPRKGVGVSKRPELELSIERCSVTALRITDWIS